jgi:hypothetical protein
MSECDISIVSSDPVALSFESTKLMLGLSLFLVVPDSMLQSVFPGIKLWVLFLLSCLVFLEELSLLLLCESLSIDSLVLLLQLSK